MNDLAVEAFVALRKHFFDENQNPLPFSLRPKRNTQDDPFDEYLAKEVLANLTGVRCVKAPGPLITPDMVLFRPNLCRGTALEELCNDIRRIVAVEVKKLERTGRGRHSPCFRS